MRGYHSRESLRLQLNGATASDKIGALSDAGATIAATVEDVGAVMNGVLTANRV